MGVELILLLLVFFLGGRFGASLFQNQIPVVQVEKKQEGRVLSEEKHVNKLTSDQENLDQDDSDLETSSEDDHENIKVKSENNQEKEVPKTALGNSNAIIRIKSSSSDSFAVELQVFEDEARAAASLASWKGKGHQPYIVIEDLGINKLYKVRVGNFGNKNEAISLANEIQSKEGVLTQVVQSE